jgi:large conductance mechanosensitive channel
MGSEFKAFIARGNVFDMAVGIVIGAAFTSVVNSFVQDILMPPLGLLTGGVDFTELYVNLGQEEFPSHAAAEAAGAPTIDYGIFINNLISFLIVAFAVFMLVRGYNRMKTLEENAPPAPTEKDCPFCRMRIPLDAGRCGHCTSELAVERG